MDRQRKKMSNARTEDGNEGEGGRQRQTDEC